VTTPPTLATSLSRAAPLAAGAAALTLAVAGELTARQSGDPIAAIPLYVAAIVLWAVTARPHSIDTPTSDGRVGSPGRLLCGLAVAVVLDGIALVVLAGDEHSNAAAWPWLASLAALVATAALAGRRGGWSPRWRGAERVVLRSPWTVVAVALVVAIAEALRLVRLDSVPLGINADEGDRAALSLQVLHGDSTAGVFEGGWYRISMVYFWTLAQVMRLFGTSYADARILGALAGTVTVATVTWIGLRHFGLRVGLIAGGLLAVAGVALQFSRETTEAGPTAMFWTVSMAFLLEGVRSGRASSWIGAGMAGGAGLYFYPSGRSWVLLAVLFLAYLTALGLGIPRRQILLRGAICLLAAVLVMAPFLSYGARHPDVLFRRAAETTVLDRANAARLDYYDPSWSMPRLLGEQVVRSLGILDRTGDQGGFWPTDRSILTPVLALLTLLGLGWSCLRWRDPRAVLLGLWFVVGFAGVVFTVETPNLQRMAVAVPASTLFAALVLDDLWERILDVGRWLAPRRRRAIPALAGVSIACVVAWIAWSETSFYFRDYASEDRWVRPNAEGQAVAQAGPGTLVVTIGRSFHMVNSGWVRLLAQQTPRGGLEAPGDLPLSLPPRTNLAFMLYPDQLAAYLPLLRALYPGGTLKRFTHPTEGLMFVHYRVSRAQWARSQGARVEAGGRSTRVQTLGEPPPGWRRFPARMRWSAGLRVPQYGTYTFLARGGDTTLVLDGVRVIGRGRPRRATVTLPAGMHAVELAATVTAFGQTPLEWSGATGAGSPLLLQPFAQSELDSRQVRPAGLLGRVDVEGETWDRRVDGTLATCCLYDDVGMPGRSVTARWRGTLVAPRTGTYPLSVFSQGQLEFRIDGQPVLRSTTDADAVTHARPRLLRGPHELDITYRLSRSPGGIEWMWTPPGGPSSIVPPSALRPPRAAGPRPPVQRAGPTYDPLIVLP
jgi:dolichyl-phosphate-mannose-protein mannosyltransferase/PA14 domain-containing protein